MKSLMCSPERLVADVLHLAGDGEVDHVAPQIALLLMPNMLDRRAELRE